MPILTIGVLNKVINQLPADFTIEYENENTRFLLDERIEIDFGNKRIILK